MGKYLVPDALAAAVLGEGNAAIAAMRTSCQANITLTDDGDVCPQTLCRVLTAQASSHESLCEVSKQLVAKLDELVKVGGSDDLGYERELKLRFLAPKPLVGGLIGKRGDKIKQL